MSTTEEIQTETRDGFDKFAEYLKEFWFIVLFIGTLVIGWTNITNEVKYQDARITALEARSKVVDTTLNQMASDVSYIRGKLEKQ